LFESTETTVTDTGLQLRMAAAGSVLFGFYAVLAYFAFQAGVGVPIIVLGSLLFVGLQYKIGKWTALRSVGAQELPADEFPEIHRSAESLSRDMGIEKPRLLIAEMGTPNAFAVGRRGAGTVVVSASLVQLLTHEELEGVLAHELAHIRNRDVVIMVMGQAVASLVGYVVFFITAFSEEGGWIAGWILSSIAQFIVYLFVLAISRYREYVADADAAQHTSGRALASALKKIDGAGTVTDADPAENVSALCIDGSRKGLLAKVLSTHPSMEKRIEKLTGS
jgi:heat shock protein HtpX